MSRSALLLRVLGALSASGCCGSQLGACPQNDARVVVFAQDPTVQVAVEGHPFTCSPGDGAVVCFTESIVDGEYPLVVTVGEQAPVEAVLVVATNQAPPYSCECEIPTGSVVLAPEGEPETPPAEDGSVPASDGGVSDEDAGA